MNGAFQDHYHEDQLIDLLHGLLAADQASECLAHLKTCSPCEDRFRELVRVREMRAASFQSVVKRSGLLIAGPESARGATRVIPFPRSARAHRRVRVGRWIPAAALAAGLTALAVGTQVVGPPHRSGSADAMLSARLSIDSELAHMRSNPQTQAELGDLQAILAAYAETDPALALERLQNLKVASSYEPIHRLYTASAQVLTGRFAAAERTLNGIDRVETLPQPWRGEVLWVRYVAVRQQGKSRRADELLHTLAQGEGPVADRARHEAARLDAR